MECGFSNSLKQNGKLKKSATFLTHTPALTVKLHYLTAGEVKNNRARSKLDVSFGF